MGHVNRCIGCCQELCGCVSRFVVRVACAQETRGVSSGIWRHDGFYVIEDEAFDQRDLTYLIIDASNPNHRQLLRPTPDILTIGYVGGLLSGNGIYFIVGLEGIFLRFSDVQVRFV